jgi:ABC-type phosphate transport system substrate-binding protein
MTAQRFAILLPLALFLAIESHAAGVKLVVNAANPSASITRAKAADLFLKRVTRWDDGKPVTPVDLSEKNASRGLFSKEVLDKEVAWVKSYWQKMIFSGRATPPAELSSDAEVLDYVRTRPDAIGYVAEGTVLPAGVKTVSVVD